MVSPCSAILHYQWQNFTDLISHNEAVVRAQRDNPDLDFVRMYSIIGEDGHWRDN
jgi:hypothetical protein